MSSFLTVNYKSSFWQPADFRIAQTDQAIYSTAALEELPLQRQVKPAEFFSECAMAKKLERKTVEQVTDELARIGITTYVLRIDTIETHLQGSKPTHVYVTQQDYRSFIAPRISCVMGYGKGHLTLAQYTEIMGYYGRLNVTVLPPEEIRRICQQAVENTLERELIPFEKEGLELPPEDQTLNERFFLYMLNKKDHPLFDTTVGSWKRALHEGDTPERNGEYRILSTTAKTDELVRHTLDQAGIPYIEAESDDGSCVLLREATYVKFIKPFLRS